VQEHAAKVGYILHADRREPLEQGEKKKGIDGERNREWVRELQRKGKKVKIREWESE
jgi:hypothetical protein